MHKIPSSSQINSLQQITEAAPHKFYIFQLWNTRVARWLESLDAFRNRERCETETMREWEWGRIGGNMVPPASRLLVSKPSSLGENPGSGWKRGRQVNTKRLRILSTWLFKFSNHIYVAHVFPVPLTLRPFYCEPNNTLIFLSYYQ